MANLAQDHQKAGHGKPKVEAEQAHRKGFAWWLLLTGILIVPLILGGFFVLPSLLPKPDLFPPLCSGNFQSAHVAAVPTPPARTSPDELPIGLSEGATIFDLERPNQQAVQYKLQAAQTIKNNPQDAEPLLQRAISSDPTDAEVQIYRENWRVLNSNHPHITFVIGVNFVLPSSVGGVSFVSSPLGASRNTLQGAFTAQKECNDRNQQDNSKTQIILMVANVGGDVNGNSSSDSAVFVADQIVNQARKDSTIVGIMGWLRSSDSVNVNHQLKIRGSTLPMLAACSSSDELTGMAHFFRICPKDADNARIAADFVLNKMHKKRIGILYQSDSSFPNSLRRDLIDNLSKAKATIVGEESYTASDQSDLQPALNKILAQKPDAIFFAGYGSDLLKLLNTNPQAHNIMIMGANSLATTSIYPSPLPDLHNVYFTAFANPEAWNNATSKPLLFQEYQDNFGPLVAPNGLPSINNSVMLSYDALLTLLYSSQQALSKHKNTITPPDLENELRQITGANAIQGVTGRIAFDSNGDQEQSKIILVEHIDGTHLVIDETHGCLQKDNCGS